MKPAGSTVPARLDPAEHLALPWRVHGVATDFDLLDVWRFDVRGGPDDFSRFVGVMRDVPGLAARLDRPTRALFALRVLLGALLGWDAPGAPRSIPGCTERSVAARLPGGRDVTAPRHDGFHPVYEGAREALMEVSNATVHGLVHLGWVPAADGAFAPTMAVYSKPRGLRGRLYMALIGPFRHHVVYPSMLRAVAAHWRAAATAAAPADAALATAAATSAR